MGKFKMPSVKEFYKRKRIYGPKKDPVWVFLEREMREMAEQGKKPYNEKVGKWLIFCRDLRHYFYLENKRNKMILERAVGPAWYTEFSSSQRNVVNTLPKILRADMLDRTPFRIKKSLKLLGVTAKIPNQTLIDATSKADGDPGLFFWFLFTKCYGHPPSEPMEKYDLTAMIMMSAIVFIDFEECSEELCKLAKVKKPPASVAFEMDRKTKPYFEPKVKLGEYLQKMYVPLFSKYPLKDIPRPKPSLDIQVKLRSQESYHNIAISNEPIAIKKRSVRHDVQTHSDDRTCKYNFWHAPLVSARGANMTPKQLAYALKAEMYRKKAKVKRLLLIQPDFGNTHYMVGGVSYSSGRPIYQMTGVASVVSKYFYHMGGMVSVHGNNVCHILGMFYIPEDIKNACHGTCNCATAWFQRTIEHLNASRCKCGHKFDLCNDGQPFETYFYPPTKHIRYWFDYAKIYQFDPTDDFIKAEVEKACKSEDSNDRATSVLIGLNPKKLLQAFLSEMSSSPLLIPHLPQAHLLNNLQEIVRKRIFGKVGERKHTFEYD